MGGRKGALEPGQRLATVHKGNVCSLEGGQLESYILMGLRVFVCYLPARGFL